MNEIPAPEHTIVALPAGKDNYIWLLRSGTRVAIVDPGEAAPVLAYLDRHALSPCAILVTHHHGDHVGGIETLQARHPMPVFGPADEPIEKLTRPLRDGERIDLPQIGAAFTILGVPGHTRGHIAYLGLDTANGLPGFAGNLFCGDTLFSCGCGRLFEGTPAQMRASLARIRALPDTTYIYPAHEYTEANARFALTVEPQNAALHAWAAEAAALRTAGHPTLPTTLKRERAVNPFLRWDVPAVIEAARSFSGRQPQDADEVFAAIREWKNGFR